MIRKGLTLTLPVLAIGWASGLWAIRRAEPGAVFPTHWNLQGQPDAWSGATEAFLAGPAIASGLTLLLAVVPLISQPLGGNLRRSAPVYLTAWVATVLLVIGLHLALVLSAFADLPPDVMPRVTAVAISLLLAVIGNVLGKARRNWFVGVRTPWTLSSETAWDRTHRLMAWIWTVGGLGLAVVSLVAPIDLAMTLLVGFALASGAVAVGYSWWVWRSADDRRASPE